MCLNNSGLNRIRCQKGSMLVIAIFIMVVMAFLVLSLSRLLSGSAQAVAVEVLGTRAFLSAQSGMEIGLQQLFPLDSAGVCNANVTFDFAVSEGMAGCEARVQCSESDNPDYPVKHYKLQSTGQCGAGESQTSRTIEMEVWR